MIKCGDAERSSAGGWSVVKEMKSTPAGAAGTPDCSFNSFNKQAWAILIEAPPRRNDLGRG